MGASPGSMEPSTEPIRVLIIAEAANPEWTSVPLVGWSHARALARLCHAHIATQVRNREAFERAGVAPDSYTCIDSEKVAARLYKLASLVRGGSGKGWTTNTALGSLAYYYFEKVLWREFGARIRAREFDVVHRITPLSPTAPSTIARKCARAGVPFVVGPLNGGVPWPRGFDAQRRREREWLSYVRGVYRLLPGYESTRRDASAILVASRDTLEHIPRRHRARCVYIPENAVDPARFPLDRDVPRPAVGPGSPLRVAFLGRLVPYKGADMLVEAAAPLVREGRVVLDIIGDGPELPRLRGMVEGAGIAGGVEFPGWIPHAKLGERLTRAHVFGFPSVREFGGGVVLEAMALGVVPIVMDYGGPAELVTPGTGFLLPMGRREGIVASLRERLARLVDEPSMLSDMSRLGRARIAALFTWEAKARQVVEVYRWVLGRRSSKPDFGMPLAEPTA